MLYANTFYQERKNILAGKTRDIESLDLTTLSGRLNKEIIEKFSSVYAFCKKNNFHQAELQAYVSGKHTPTIDKLLIFKNTGLDINYIMDGDESTKKEKFIKVFTNPVAAGTGNPVFNEDYFLFPFIEGMKLDYNKAVGFKLSGDSMLPKLNEDDIIFCEYTTIPKTGKVIVCLLNGSAYIKQYIFENDKILLHSYNPKYEDIEIKRKDKFKVIAEIRSILTSVEDL